MWIFVNFKINQDFIAKNLCENRAKPKMHCNGNCVLMKKLKKADNEEQKQIPQTLKEKQEVLYSCQLTNFSLTPQFICTEKSKLNSHYSLAFSSSHFSSIFRPPKLILI
ncbi:MAG: hypothetical protein U5L45_05420 [Saprospiraceae bacterium]|nr:hypothetical protein [Saprospiraceae bacterium]